MIVDTLENAVCCETLNPLFPKAFGHLRDLAARTDLPTGRVELEGDDLFAVVVDGPGRAVADAKLETHRRYIDIQFTAGGCDRIGWSPRCGLSRSEGYDSEKDLEFYGDAPQTWIEIIAGQLAIFFPDDAHAPMGNTGKATRKIVIKVAV